MNTMKIILIIIAFSLLSFSNTNAQQIEKLPFHAEGDFKTLQKILSDWRDTANVQDYSYWKYIKRWEHELSMHTDGSGNLGDASDLIKYKTQRASQKSSAFSASWYPVGPDLIPENATGYLENGLGRINCMAFHPTNPDIFFVGVAQGGLWKTSNGGLDWTPLTDDLPITRVSDICINPNNPDEMYISLCDYAYIGVTLELEARKRFPHYGLGVFKSTDGGSSWTQTSLAFDLTDRDGSLISNIVMHPENTNEIVACGTSGLYKSFDSGETWTTILDTLMWDLVPDPADNNVLYAASGWLRFQEIGYASIFKSTDFGETWQELPTGIPTQNEVQRIKIAISESNPNYVYAITVDLVGGLHSMYRSIDAGSSWTELPQQLNILSGGNGSAPGGQGTYDLVLWVDRYNPEKVYAGGVNMWMSDDAGFSFNPISHWTLSYGPTIHADMHYFTQHPLTDEYFVNNDGGIYKTSSIESQTWQQAEEGFLWPSEWTNLSNGMQITSFYRISSSRNETDRLIAGAQDNATAYFNGSGWRAIFGGDGMDNYLSPTDDFQVLGSSQFGFIYHSYDEYETDASFFNAADVGEEGEWTSPIAGCYDESGKVYLGYENVWLSEDEGAFFYLPGFVNGTGEPMTAIGVSPSNCDRLYAASKVHYVNEIPAQFYRSSDGAQSWDNLTQGLPDSLYITSIAVSPLNEDQVYVAYAGFVDGIKVFKSEDAGNTWQNHSLDLGNFPVNNLSFIPNTNHLLAATDAGVFFLEDGSNTWVDESAGLPNVIISDIEINVATNTIYVSTFGRGIWASDLNLILSQKGTSQTCLEEVSFKALSQNQWEITLNNKQCNAKINRLEVIDVMGKVVLQTEVQNDQVQFSLSGLSSGVYFARLSGDGVMAVQKFIKP